jgi:hypothetical protein
MSQTDQRQRRNPAPIVLGVAVALLAIYYAVVVASGVLSTSTHVPIGSSEPDQPSDRITLQMGVQEVNLTKRVIQANVMPVPSGSFVGAKAGEISRSLRIEVSSGGVTTSVVTYPGESIVDPTAVSLALDTGDTAYPLDRPFADLQLSIQDDKSGKPVPFDVTMDNSARPWVLSGDLGSSRVENGRALYPLTISGHRDPLSVTLVAFYVLAILLTTLMAVVTIGSALIKRQLDFSNVIWLSATMLSFPALRSAMPGAPPIGTAMDFVVFFPCICLIALLLMWTGAHLLWRESAILRRRHYPADAPEDEPVSQEPVS